VDNEFSRSASPTSSIASISDAKLTQYGYSGWAVLEWECCLKHPEDGAREGAPFIAKHMIRRADKAFDDFAGGSDPGLNRALLGLT
jgi:hypothetical protein